MRTIKRIHTAHSAPIADLITYSPLPSPTLSMIDPFLFLNHHGPQVYPPNNNGLPFGPHPHRGMETVTFILEGDIMHKDSSGHESIMKAGGVQYMSAGKGLIHAEVSSEEFKREGGKLEILQLWINLPSKNKKDEPHYKGLQKDEIPIILTDNGKVTLDLLFGELEGQKGPFNSPTNVFFTTIYLQKEGKLDLKIPQTHNLFFYIVKGKVEVNGSEAKFRQLVEFNNEGDKLNIKALEESTILLGHAKPLNEPVVAQGPFVMNTEEEIMQAYSDYRQGKFGIWNG
jgi:quercetin 2,3-dioxygenase